MLKCSERLSKWLYLTVFLVGALTIFSFSPFELYPLAWFGPSVLFYALTKAQTKTQYFKLGWVYGLGLFGAGTSWPFYSLYFYANAHIAVAVLGTSLFVAFVALFSTGLFGLIASLFRYHSLTLRLLLFFPASWVFVEWIRTWFLTGFPWLFLGNTQIDSFLSSIAPVTGVLGVSLFCALLAGCLLALCIGDRVTESLDTDEGINIDGDIDKDIHKENIVPAKKMFNLSLRVLASIVIAFIIGSSVVLSQVVWTEKKGDPLTVSVLQSNIAQEVKLDPESLSSSIDLYKKMTDKSSESDLIVWPETALFNSFSSHMDSLIFPLQESLKGTKKAILVGGFFVNENNGVENSVLAITADNRTIYSKRHLVPFGEYTPLLEYFRWLSQWIQLPYDNITKGENNGVLRINDYVAQMTICYEDAFGTEMINALPEADILINVTHDGWFTGSFEPYQHMQIARMRALEMGRYMVRATTSGPAGVIDEKGKILATAPIYTQNIITHKVQPMKGTTPYVYWGNWFIIILISFVLLLGLLFKRKRMLWNQ